MNAVYISVFHNGIRVTDSPAEGFSSYKDYELLTHPECKFFIASYASTVRLNKKRRAEIANCVMFYIQDRKLRVSQLWAVQ